MASTYVNDLRLNEMATGDASGTWGTTTNTNLELIAEAFSYGTEAITTNADTHTTTIADGATDPGRSMFLKYTGALDSACTVTIGPNTVSKMWFIENATTGSQNLVISQGTGANITIPAGDTKIIYADGAGAGGAMVDALASISAVDLKVQDDLTVTDDVTIGGDIDVDGTTNLDVVDIDGAVDMASTLTLAGNADFNGDLDVDGTSNLDVVDIDGAVDMASTLTLAGNADFNGDLDVDGTSNLDVVDIDGAVDMASTLAVTGIVTLTDDLIIGDGKTIGSASDVDAMTIASNGQVTFTQTLIGTALDISGDVDVDGTLETDNLTIGSAQGSDGQVLTSTGSGVGWEDAASGGVSGLTGLVENNSIWLGDDPSSTTDTASYNVALGTTALDAITTADNCTAIGYAALGANTTGADNVAVGSSALSAATTRVNLTAVGFEAGKVTEGAYAGNSVFVGYQAGAAVTNAGNLICIGSGAADTETTGNDSIYIGKVSNGGNSASNSQNTALGNETMAAASAGYGNTAIGFQALNDHTSGISNTCVGREAGDKITSGGNNVCIGYDAGSDAMESITTDSNNVIIGNNSINNAEVKVDWTVGSDERDKTDIENLPNNAGLNFVNQLRPVTYVWDNRSNYYKPTDENFGERDHSKKSTTKQVGFIAQEVKAIEESIGWTDDHIVNTSNEQSYKLMYSQVIPMLTKAIQELSAKVEELENKGE